MQAHLNMKENNQISLGITSDGKLTKRVRTTLSLITSENNENFVAAVVSIRSKANEESCCSKHRYSSDGERRGREPRDWARRGDDDQLAGYVVFKLRRRTKIMRTSHIRWNVGGDDDTEEETNGQMTDAGHEDMVDATLEARKPWVNEKRIVWLTSCDFPD